MTTRFTKGGWVANYDDVIASTNPEDLICTCVERGNRYEEVAANAYLIAAAPDLYNALETLTTYCEIKGVPTEAAYAALAKARGEQP